MFLLFCKEVELIVVKEDTVGKRRHLPYETDIGASRPEDSCQTFLTILFFVFCFGKMSMEPNMVLSALNFCGFFHTLFCHLKKESMARDNLSHRIFRGIVILLDHFHTLSSSICFSLWTTESGRKPSILFCSTTSNPRDGENLIPVFLRPSNCIPIRSPPKLAG